MKNLIYLGVLASVFALFLSSCSEQVDGQEIKTGIPVKLSPVGQATLSFPIHTSGVLANSAEMKLSFKTGGIIGIIKVREGKIVKKGQLLAQLKQNEISANVKQAKSGFDKSSRDYERVKKLYADNVATLEQLQNSETAMEVAKAYLEIARFNLRHSSIHAPVSGKILMQFGEENEMIGPGNPVFILGSIEKSWIIKAAIVDRDILKISDGDSTHIEFDAYPDRIFRGTVQTISGAAHPATGLFELEIRLHKTDIPLFSGFIGKIKIFPKKVEKYAVIPVSAISEGTRMEADVYAYDVRNGIAVKKRIKIAVLENELVYVSSGLESIAEVVSEGTPYLTDKAQIEIINETGISHSSSLNNANDSE